MELYTHKNISVRHSREKESAKRKGERMERLCVYVLNDKEIDLSIITVFLRKRESSG